MPLLESILTHPVYRIMFTRFSTHSRWLLFADSSRDIYTGFVLIRLTYFTRV
jgi:hypothetical protein